MEWTRSHGSVLAEAVSRLLGEGRRGEVAFVRCLATRVVETVAADIERFVIPGWDVFLVCERTDDGPRSISADRAVEIRESKGPAAVFLVDTASIGAGMDGVFSATRELTEVPLFAEATRVALRRIDPEHRRYVREAIKRARERGLGIRVSPWQELDFCCHVVDGRQPGASLGRIGLWPVKRNGDGAEKDSEDLRESRRFVDRLLDARSIDLTPRRIGKGLNPGRKSRKVLQGCTICVFCRSTGPCWTVPRKRENRSEWRDSRPRRTEVLLAWSKTDLWGPPIVGPVASS